MSFVTLYCIFSLYLFFFFFSSRRRHTRLVSDWSSDVCSSDLDVTLMKQMAHALGKDADEKKYAEVFEKIRDSFNKAYVRSDGFVGGVPPPPVFATGTATKLSDKPIDTQTGYVLALKMNLLPDRSEER